MILLSYCLQRWTFSAIKMQLSLTVSLHVDSLLRVHPQFVVSFLASCCHFYSCIITDFVVVLVMEAFAHTHAQ